METAKLFTGMLVETEPSERFGRVLTRDLLPRLDAR